MLFKISAAVNIKIVSARALTPSSIVLSNVLAPTIKGVRFIMKVDNSEPNFEIGPKVKNDSILDIKSAIVNANIDAVSMPTPLNT